MQLFFKNKYIVVRHCQYIFSLLTVIECACFMLHSIFTLRVSCSYLQSEFQFPYTSTNTCTCTCRSQHTCVTQLHRHVLVITRCHKYYVLTGSQLLNMNYILYTVINSTEYIYIGTRRSDSNYYFTIVVFSLGGY